MTTAQTFDPVRYKATTKEQWDNAAEAWHRWTPLLDEWLGGATERMLEIAAIGKGLRLLDVAAGAGGQSLQPARRVGPEGHVLATDISATILAYTRREAEKAGFS